MKLVVPMAGRGSRFAEKGYNIPKPLIDVHGKPMIVRIVENFNDLPIDSYIFMVLEEHVQKYNLCEILKQATNGKPFEIIVVKEVTQGSASTILLAKDLINTYEPIIIANSDQYVKFNKINFQVLLEWANPASVVFVFNSTHSKWSFVRLGEFFNIIEVAEKNPISNIANCGIFYFKHGNIAVNAIECMIRKNIRVNGEYYLAPSLNELIPFRDRILLPFFVDRMIGFGTPEDLEIFLNSRETL